MRQPLYRIGKWARWSSAAAALAAAFLITGCGREKIPPPIIPGPGVTVLAAGDIADCRYAKAADSGAALTAELVERELARDASALVLTMGDNTYPIGAPAEFNDCYQPTWGRFKQRTYPSPGNHDYGTPNAAGYYAYFGANAGPAGRGYYSMVLGNWLLLSLNSNLKASAATAQIEWLKTELAQHKGGCVLAYWHHPVHSSGGHGDSPRMTEVWRILAEAGAELALSGHDHDYERFAPQDAAGKLDRARGLRQFVAGTGGTLLSPLRLRKENSERSDNSTHGVLKLRLKDSGYEWEFLPVKEGGFSDQGAALCH